jgi:hypothetical protein
MPAHLKLHPFSRDRSSVPIPGSPDLDTVKDWCGAHLRSVSKLEEHVRQLHWPRSYFSSIPFWRAMSSSASSCDCARQALLKDSMPAGRNADVTLVEIYACRGLKARCLFDRLSAD